MAPYSPTFKNINQPYWSIDTNNLNLNVMNTILLCFTQKLECEIETRGQTKIT